MTIKRETFTKDGETTVLEYGMGGGQYYVKIDDVVLSQTTAWRFAWDRGQEARHALAATGWEKA